MVSVAFFGKVYGRVQGVGYRYYVVKTASRYGINGWVRNEPDGTVEVFYEGDPEKVALFSKQLEKGPPASYVRKVLTQEKKPQGYGNFAVEY